MKYRPLSKTSTFHPLKSAMAILLVFCLAGAWALPSYKVKAFAAESTYIVRLKDPKGLGEIRKAGSGIVQRFAFSSQPQFKNIYTFRSAEDYSELRDRLLPYSFYMEPQVGFQAQLITTNDPGFTDTSENIDKQWGLAKTGAAEAWAKTTGSASNVVAVIDTGIDATHEDLQSINFVPGYNIITRQSIPAGTNSDDNGHGTLIAGVLGATANNGIGVAGVNWKISLMPLKALDNQGKGEAAAISEAIVWAVDHGANIINLSLGGIGFGHDTALANAISYAFGKNAVIVAAAGNDVSAAGSNIDQEPVYPICHDNNANMVIGVAATDHNDLKAPFSNYGRNCIDVSAPGKRILSTINYDPFSRTPSPNSYAYASGSSLAVPFVAGQAALLKALFPEATNAQIRDRIISTADPIDNLNLSQCQGASCRGFLGAGRINIQKSVEVGRFLPSLAEGDLIKAAETGAIYRITGSQKRLVSPFVFNQRFLGAAVKVASLGSLQNYPEGAYETPNDGTLVKLDSSPTVYMMLQGSKLPVTYGVFVNRGLNFGQINTVSFSEISSWPSGSFLPPKEGSLVKEDKTKTVYWVVGGVLHPINYSFFLEKGLNVFPIMSVSKADLASFPKGEAYIR